MSNDEGIDGTAARKIALLLEGALGERESLQLLDELVTDDELRDQYIRQATMHAMLKWSHGTPGGASEGDINPAVIAELLDEEEGILRRQEAEEAQLQAELEARQQKLRRQIAELSRRNAQRTEPIVIPLAVVYLGSGVVAAAVLWFIFAVLGARNGDVAQEQPPPQVEPEALLEVATLRDAADAQVFALSESDDEGGEALSIEVGSRLTAGRYAVLRGLLDLEFDNGAKLILEAPTLLELKRTDLVQLDYGKVVGNVPPNAKGFTIQTSRATIVDLGTEFGVDLPATSEDVEVHVFVGEVEFARRITDDNEANGTPVTLLAGQAARLDAASGEISAKQIEEERFVRALPTTIDFVGIDQGAGSFLRTTSVWKSYDPDKDSVYGTAGYYFFNSNDGPKVVRYVDPFDNLIHSLPSFVEDRVGFTHGLKMGDGVYSVFGHPGYLDIDDPREAPGALVADINSGLICYDIAGTDTGTPEEIEMSQGIFNPQGARPGSDIELCKIALGSEIPKDGFRLGVMTDNGDQPDVVPTVIRVVVNDVQQQASVSSSNLDGDMYFFDIRRAQAGDELTVYVQTATGRFASIGGLTFDVLPASQTEDN